MWSSVIVAGTAVGNLVAGNQLGVTGANPAVLIGVLWATSFLALVVMDATRQALHRRKTLRPENEPQRGGGDLRFTIAVAALSLAMGSITWRPSSLLRPS